MYTDPRGVTHRVHILQVVVFFKKTCDDSVRLIHQFALFYYTDKKWVTDYCIQLKRPVYGNLVKQKSDTQSV